MYLEPFRDFLGWCTLINFGVLILMTVSLLLFRKKISGLHARMFGFSESQAPIEFYRFIAYYKMAVLIFNLVPYLALRVMA
jgi:hypothetical protein